MSIETGIVSLLTADPTVSGLVATRIYPVIIPEGSAFPCLLYHWIDKPRWNTLDNADDTPHGRLQISSWAQNFADVITLEAAVRAALAGFVGLAGGVTVQSIIVIDTRDTWEYMLGTTGLYRRDSDFEICYQE